MNNLEKETMEMAKRAARKYVYDEIDWEQRRYEIAKDICAQLHAQYWAREGDGSIANFVCDTMYDYTETDSPNEALAMMSVQGADALIKELKGGKPCE